MIVFAIGVAAFCATMAGGLVALQLKDKLHLILGFSAGAVVGVAFFDLLPEAMDLSAKNGTTALVPIWLALGFLTYLVLDRLVPIHSTSVGERDTAANFRGALGATSLSLHSFLDGAAIGVAFQLSASVGAIVAIAVLTHDFSDGINTANMVLKNGGSRRAALRWLLVDALAPAVGIAFTQLFAISDHAFAPLLALFAGFFLYIGASDLVPESYHSHPKALTTAMTLLGASVIYLAVCFAR